MNTLLYPNDYASNLSQEADQASFALENAVTLLQLQSRDTAIANAHTRRIAGQNIIATNNRLGIARAVLMPLTQVGAKIAPLLPLQGTVAHMAGGRDYSGVTNRSAGFYFSNESAFLEGIQLSEFRCYSANIFNRVAGYWIGGLGLKPTKAIDRLSYPLNAVRRMSAELESPLIGGAGVGDSTIGCVLGGAPLLVGAPISVNTSLKSMQIYTYATESNQPVQNALQDPRFAAHNGTSSGNIGAVYGGSSKGWTLGTFSLLSVDLLNFTTRAVSRSTAVLARPHFVHACFGDKTRGVIAGGAIETSAPSDFVSEYVYATQAVQTLSAKLAEPKVCCDGTGSNVAGYVLGGDTNQSAAAGWIGTDTIDKFTYALNATSRIDSKLPTLMADQGCVSDYAATLY